MPAGGDGAHPADQKEGMRAREGRGRDANALAPVVKWLAGPGFEQGFEALVHEASAIVPGLARGVVLHRSIAQARHETEAPAADEIEDGDVLGQADRVVEGHEERADVDPDALGPGDDHGGQGERGGEPAVFGAVVLLEIDGLEAALLGVDRHLDRGFVALGLVGGILGEAGHVQSQGGLDRQVVSFFRGSVGR